VKRQIAEKGLPTGDALLTATVTTEPALKNAARYSFAARIVEVEVDVEIGHVRVVKYVAAHDSGRIIDPLIGESQVKGGATMGIGMALHEELLTTRHRACAHRRLLRRDDPSRRARD
jgi:CO/xanthine dehydrogenase Mo-binding subunit